MLLASISMNSSLYWGQLRCGSMVLNGWKKSATTNVLPTTRDIRQPLGWCGSCVLIWKPICRSIVETSFRLWAPISGYTRLVSTDALTTPSSHICEPSSRRLRWSGGGSKKWQFSSRTMRSWWLTRAGSMRTATSYKLMISWRKRWSQGNEWDEVCKLRQAGWSTLTAAVVGMLAIDWKTKDDRRRWDLLLFSKSGGAKESFKSWCQVTLTCLYQKLLSRHTCHIEICSSRQTRTIWSM